MWRTQNFETLQPFYYSPFYFPNPVNKKSYVFVQHFRWSDFSAKAHFIAIILKDFFALNRIMILLVFWLLSFMTRLSARGSFLGTATNKLLLLRILDGCCNISYQITSFLKPNKIIILSFGGICLRRWVFLPPAVFSGDRYYTYFRIRKVVWFSHEFINQMSTRKINSFHAIFSFQQPLCVETVGCFMLFIYIIFSQTIRPNSSLCNVHFTFLYVMFILHMCTYYLFYIFSLFAHPSFRLFSPFNYSL